jgi:phosphate transport system substrate-binding protein
MREFSIALAFGALLSVFGCSGDKATSPVLHGAGSTFVQPMMVQWSYVYGAREGGCKIDYRGLGSGSGIKHLIENDVDFACTDGPMSDEEMEMARKAVGEVIHIPLVLGAVVPVYNLEEISEPLQFTGPVLADIFLGKIKKWNEEPIRKLNPNVKLPDIEIRVVHRRDKSGTTYVWCDYLAKTSPEWEKHVGKGNDPKWPVGDAVNLNEGMADFVLETPGSIGYVELSYAYSKDLTIGRVQNRENEFVRVTLKSVTTAVNNALVHIPDDLRFSVTDAPGKGSYPISSATWAVVYVNQRHGNGRQLVDFLKWAVDDGQQYAEASFYAKLPPRLVELAGRKIDQIKVSN